MCKESDLFPYKAKLSIFEYTFVVNAFRAFQGTEQKIWTKMDLQEHVGNQNGYQDIYLYLEEQHFVKNSKNVFGVDCPFFGKLLYIYMSNGYDRSKISLFRFLECLYPIFDDSNRLGQNKIAFNILDIDHDKFLNVINLLHLQKNFSPCCKLGQEINKIMEYQISHNLHNKNSFRHEKINYDIFNKVVGRSCIIKEIQECIFGSNLENTPGGKNCPTPKEENSRQFRQMKK